MTEAEPIAEYVSEESTPEEEPPAAEGAPEEPPAADGEREGNDGKESKEE